MASNTDWSKFQRMHLLGLLEIRQEVGKDKGVPLACQRVQTYSESNACGKVEKLRHGCVFCLDL